MRRLRHTITALLPHRVRRLWPLWAALVMTGGGLASGWPIPAALICGVLTAAIFATAPRRPR